MLRKRLALKYKLSNTLCSHQTNLNKSKLLPPELVLLL